MNNVQNQTLNNLVATQRRLGQDWITYWQHYSNFGTWQFWANVILLVVPLVLLLFCLDRQKAFRIGFFGWNVHVWFSYIDVMGGTNGLWVYPYKAFPFLSTSVSVDVSFVPVVYMLTYQWTLNRHKNFYLYGTVLSAVLAFIIKPLLSWIGLFKMYGSMNYVYLSIGYLIIMLLAKGITDFFAYLQNSADDTDAI